MGQTDPIARLRGDLQLRRDGVRVVVDGLLRRKVSDYVDVAVLVDVVEKGFGETFVARILADHGVTLRGRLRVLLDGADDASVGARLPSEAREKLESHIATMALPRFAWLKGAVDPALLRELLSPVWQEVFAAGFKRFGAVGEGALGLGSSLAGALSRVGGAAMKGVGLKGGISSAAQDFAAGATDLVREQLAERLASEEGQRLSEKIRRQVFARVVQTDGREILSDLERMPLDELVALGAPISAYNAASAFGRALVRGEFEAALAVEGERTVEELLAEAGTLPEVRAYLRVMGEGCLDALLEDEAFDNWLGRWLGSGGADTGA
ncbi:MAG: hypothetical protein AAF938_12535 [Myxococcota bacterium]